MSAESAVESGLSSTFFPHGLGHLIGLQVHDVAGSSATTRAAASTTAGHRLRLTRALEPRMVTTVSPAFISSTCCSPSSEQAAGDDVDWDPRGTVSPLWRIRIEDDVVCTDRERELTRDAFAAAA
jgi:Xaa-Pro dipeptidase